MLTLGTWDSKKLPRSDSNEPKMTIIMLENVNQTCRELRKNLPCHLQGDRKSGITLKLEVVTKGRKKKRLHCRGNTVVQMCTTWGHVGQGQITPQWFPGCQSIASLGLCKSNLLCLMVCISEHPPLFRDTWQDLKNIWHTLSHLIRCFSFQTTVLKVETTMLQHPRGASDGENTDCWTPPQESLSLECPLVR